MFIFPIILFTLLQAQMEDSSIIASLLIFKLHGLKVELNRSLLPKSVYKLIYLLSSPNIIRIKSRHCCRLTSTFEESDIKVSESDSNVKFLNTKYYEHQD